MQKIIGYNKMSVAALSRLSGLPNVYHLPLVVEKGFGETPRYVHQAGPPGPEEVATVKSLQEYLKDLKREEDLIKKQITKMKEQEAKQEMRGGRKTRRCRRRFQGLGRVVG